MDALQKDGDAVVKQQAVGELWTTLCEVEIEISGARSLFFNCFIELALHSYEQLGDYMTTIIKLTSDFVERDDEDLTSLVMEFWETLSVVEKGVLDQEKILAAQNLPIVQPCLYYVAAAVEQIVPFLLETLTKQDENADMEDHAWFENRLGSAICLSNVAELVEDLVVPVVMPFVTANLQNENWRLREAATMAFASILEGTSVDATGGVVSQSIPVLLNALSDSLVMVRATSVYAIKEICLLDIQSIPLETLPLLVNGLGSKLRTESRRVSALACIALERLFFTFGENDCSGSGAPNTLSPNILVLVRDLLLTYASVEANADDNHNLREESIEAVIAIVRSSSATVFQPLWLYMLPVSVETMDRFFWAQFPYRQQKLWCDLVTALCDKLSDETLQPFCEIIVTPLIGALRDNRVCRRVQPAVFSTLTSVATSFGPGFEPCMPFLHELIIQAEASGDDATIEEARRLRSSIQGVQL